MNASRHYPRLALTLIVSLVAAFTPGCERAPDLEQIVERNVTASGGRAAIEAVQAIEVDLHIVDPGFQVDGHYRAARPGKMRIDVSAEGKHVFTEAFDGQKGWQWQEGSEVKETSEKARATLLHGVELPFNLYGLHEVRQRGHRLELAPREVVDGVNYYVLKLTLTDGYEALLYVDPKSWLITRRRDFRALHVDVDPTPTTIEQRRSDFRQIAGVWYAFATVENDLVTGKELERTTIQDLKVNPPIDDSVFSKL